MSHTSLGGSPSTARWFLEKLRKLGCNHMRRLAAAHALLGGFWEKLRNVKKFENSRVHAFQSFHIIHIHTRKIKTPNRNSPNLVSFA